MMRLQCPAVVAQGMWMHATIKLAPPATGPASGIVGTTGLPPLCIAVVGDYTAAGCGVASHDEGFAGAWPVRSPRVSARAWESRPVGKYGCRRASSSRRVVPGHAVPRRGPGRRAATLPLWTPPGIRRGREVTLAVGDVMHLLVAAALTYALGFERDLRGAAAGDRVFALIGAGAGIVGVLAVHGAPTALQGVLTGIGFIGAGLVFRQEPLPTIRGLTTAAAIFAAAAIGAAAGEGRLLLAAVATAFALLVLEIRYIPVLRVLDGRRWTSRFRHDEWPPRPGGIAADDRRRETGDH
jgi:putative Mg2+ transporter-C (MgtC) family protein